MQSEESSAIGPEANQLTLERNALPFDLHQPLLWRIVGDPDVITMHAWSPSH